MPKRTKSRSRTDRARIEQLERRRLLSVVISEFLASNTTGILDQDGDHSDWIELRNTGTAAVNVGGWYLTDNSASLTKWQLPSTSIAAGAQLLVFASGKNRAVAGQQLHTNFSLDEAGEYLGLVMPDGTTVADAYAPFPAQLPNISYGIAASSSSIANDALVDENAAATVISPASQNAAVDDYWREVGFDDSGWIHNETAIGFDRDHSLFQPYYGGTELTTTQMPTSRRTAYIRVPFTVADKDQLVGLELQMRYDDGFIAYLNGHEVKRVNFASDGIPAWNSSASGSRPSNSAAILYETFDLTPYLDRLQNGDNVLAIHALNNGTTPNPNDLLIDPLLSARRAIATAPGYMSTPTPGANNAVGTLGFVGDTHFSIDRGFFTNAFPVAITSNTAGANIRYTLDGSEPSATAGTLYTGPITITTTTVLRAVAYKPGYTPSNVDTETYLFLNDVIHQDGSNVLPYAPWSHFGTADWEMDPDVVNNPTYANTIVNDLKAIPSVSVVMNWNDLFGPNGQGIYISGKSVERATSLEYFTPDNSDQWHLDAAIEMQGHSSTTRWNADKMSFQVKFKSPYGPTNLDHAVFTDPMFDAGATSKFDTLILDATFNYSWIHQNPVQNSAAKYVHDQVVADFQNLVGSNAPHGKFVHLYLNGLYWGLYYLHERPDESFAEEYFGGDKDDYDVIKHNATTPAEGGVTAINNYATLLNATRQDMSVLANYQSVTNLLDVQDLADYMIAHYYAGNYDWGHNNWYATHDRVTPGAKWHFHAWDQEHAFRDVNENTTLKTTADGITGSPIEIHYNLMANAEYKMLFSDRVQKHMANGGTLTPAVAGNIYATRANQIDRAIVGESARWGDNRVSTPYTRADWRAIADGLLANFFPQRTNIVLGQFTAKGWLQSLGAPLYSQFGGTVNPGFQLTITKPAGSPGSATIYYTLDGSDPRLVGGGLAPSAIAYSNAITLNGSTQVKARIRNGTGWSAIVDATFLSTVAYPLRITELNYHPPDWPGLADDEEAEFFELLNTGNSTISLNGVQIGGFASTPYSFALGLTLGAGQRIIVAKNPSVFTQIYGSGINVAPGGYGTQNLSNGGESVTLLGPVGETLQSFTYDDVAPWPTSPDGFGPTLEIINPLGDPNDPANWRASAQYGGSPGSDGAAAAPTVTDGTFDFQTAHRVSIQFSHDVLSSLAANDLQVTPASGGAPISPASFSWSASDKRATFTLGSILPDGNYIATLPAGSVNNAGTPLANNFEFEFYVLAGDANRDRHVDAADQAILTAHLNQSGNFSAGDFDYSGTVNALDQAVLDARWHYWLPEPGAVALPASGGDDAYRLRFASSNLLDVFAGVDLDPSLRVPLTDVTSISFASAAGNDSLTLLGTSGTADTAVFCAATCTLNGLTINHSSVESIRFDGAGGFDNVTVNSGAIVTFPITQRLGALAIDGTVVVAPNASSGIGILTRSLSLGSSATLDLSNNDLILDYSGASPLPAVQSLVVSARNAGTWDGPGITSSAARDNPQHNTMLGVIERADYAGSTFDTEPLDADMVLVKYSYYGDANFDGRVTFDDYVRIDTGFNAHRTGWANGDFNLDGVVNFDDYVLIDIAFNTQSGTLGRLIPGRGGAQLRSGISDRLR